MYFNSVLANARRSRKRNARDESGAEEEEEEE